MHRGNHGHPFYVVLDHVKSSRTRLDTPIAEMFDLDTGVSVPDQVGLLELARVLRSYLAMLGDDQREAVELRFLRGLTVTEAAAVMGRNEYALKALQHRACLRLSKLMPCSVRDLLPA